MRNCALIFLLTVAASLDAADFLLVRSLGPLSVLDRFEQPMTDSEKSAHGSGIPLRIEKEDAVLGDGITRGMRGSLGRNQLTLLRGDDRKLIGASGAGIEFVRGAQEMGDTVEAAAGFEMSVFPGSIRHNIRQGESFFRVFRAGARFYVRRLATGEYGWVSSSAAFVSRRMVRQASADLNTQIRDRVVARVESANESYRKLFIYFNDKTNAQKAIPEWKMSTEGRSIRFYLNAPYNKTGELDRSTAILVRDLEGLLLGQPYTVTYREGVIAVDARSPTLPTEVQ